MDCFFPLNVCEIINRSIWVLPFGWFLFLRSVSWVRSFIIIFSTTCMSEIQLKITWVHNRGSIGHSIPCWGQFFFLHPRGQKGTTSGLEWSLATLVTLLMPIYFGFLILCTCILDPYTDCVLLKEKTTSTAGCTCDICQQILPMKSYDYKWVA